MKSGRVTEQWRRMDLMAVQCVKQEKWTEYLQREGILLDMKFGHACQIY